MVLCVLRYRLSLIRFFDVLWPGPERVLRGAPLPDKADKTNPLSQTNTNSHQVEQFLLSISGKEDGANPSVQNHHHADHGVAVAVLPGFCLVCFYWGKCVWFHRQWK